MSQASLFGRLFWVFMLGAFAVGGGLYFRPERRTEVEWAPWLPFLLGAAVVCLAQEGVLKGRIRGRRLYLSRKRHPVNFWGIVAVYYATGVSLIAASLWISLK